MANYIRLPNGSFFEAEEGMTPTQARQEAFKLYPEAFGLSPREEAPKKGGVSGSLGKGVESMMSSLRTAGEAIFDPEAAAKASMGRQEDLERKYADEVSWDKAKQVYEQQGLMAAAKEVASQVPKAIAEQAPNIAATIGGARAGAALGSLAGPAGTVVGGIAGAALPTFLQQFGSNIERQAQEGAPISRGAAAAAAVPQAALDVAGTFIPLGGQLVSKLTGIPAKALTMGAGNAAKLAEERLAITLLKGTAVGAATEIPTEVAQQMLERMQAGLSLTSPDAMDEYGKTAYQVGLLGPIGGAGRLSERGAARLDVQQQKDEAAKQAAEAEQAAKNRPDALKQLDTDFRAAHQQLQAINDQLKDLKPIKGATDEDKAAYQEAKAKRDEFLNETYKPLRTEFMQRKDAIDRMFESQQAMIEANTAEQPAQQAALPSDIPNAMPYHFTDTVKLMDQHDQLRNQLGAVEDKLAAGPDVDTQAQLMQQRGQLMSRMQEMAPTIEERGGVTDTAKEYAAKVKTAEKERLNLLQNGDFEAAQKQAEKVKALQARVPYLEALGRRQTAGMGESMQMFPEETPQPEAEGIKYVAYPKDEKVDLNAKPTVPVQTVAATKEEAVSATREPAKTTLKPAVLDLFDPSNIIRTAYNNGDEKTLNDMAAHADRTAMRAALDKNSTERERLVNVLDSKLGVEGEVRERADLFSQQYTPKQQSEFKNGTNAEVIERPRYDDEGKPVIGKDGRPVVDTVKLQDVYDKGGPAAVEYENIVSAVEDLARKVTTRQGNAKESLYQQLVNTANEHQSLLDSLQNGNLTAKEKYNVRRRVKSLENSFKATEGKITPIRDEIKKLWDSLYTTKRVEKPSVIAARKKAEANEAAKGPKAKSRTAATAARIERGDVRYEAENSTKMRQLAATLGIEEKEYDTFGDKLLKHVQKLEKEYGKYDPVAVKARIDMATKLETKAIELGKKTPEYKATLKEQTEIVREALSQSKQTLKTKRTPQVTRKQSGAPKELRVAGSRMTESEIDAEVKAANKADGGTAYRLREGAGNEVVDAGEAQKVIDNLKLPENVKFVYAPTSGKIPVRLLNEMAKDGVDVRDGMVQGAVFPDGTVLVVGDQHANVKDLEETIAHEIIGHYGIDTIIGTQRLNEFAKKTDVIKLAEDIGGKKMVAEVLNTVRANADLGRSEEVQKLQALREIIAHTAEAKVTESFREKAGRWMKELVGMIRAGLREMGFKNLGDMSTSDVFYMLKKSRQAFANKQIGPYRAADGQMAFRLRRQASNSVVGREPTIMDKLITNFTGMAGRVQFIDQHAALEEVFRKGKTAGEISSLEATNANFLLRFGQQRSQFAGQFLTHGPVKVIHTKKDGGVETLYKSVKGDSMMDVATALNKAKIGNQTEQENMFTVYLAGQRANQVGWEKLNFSDPAAAKAEFNDIMNKLKGDATAKAAFEEAAKLYQKYNAGLLDFLVDTGAITPAKAAELKAITYVPFYRINGNGEVQLMIDKEHPVRIANTKDQPQLKELIGGNTSIMPVFTSSAQNTFMITGMGLRNQAVKETCFALKKIGVASRVNEGMGPKGDNVVRFFKNGKPYHAVIDTDMYGVPAELIVRGMEGIKTTVPAVVKAFGIPANILRSFIVRNPAYAIRQVVRDPLNAWLTTGTDATPVLASMKELAHMVAGRSEAERKLMESGAISSNVYAGNEQDMAKFLKDISAGKSFWERKLAQADAFALQGDAATRAVIYKDSLAKGMTEQEALLRTLESMNFSRRGVSPSMQWLSVMIPFFNAQVQGLDVIYRAYKGKMPYSEQLKIKEKMIQRGLLLAAGTIAYAAMMSDDEAYKRAKPEERYANWFVHVPGFSDPVRVPMPFEMGFFFKALPEAVYNMAANDEKVGKTMSGLGKISEQFNPFGMPQAIKPATEAILGKSFYGGDIESTREKGEMATTRARDTTTGLAKLIGLATGHVGVSPIMVDHLIGGYTGPLGLALVQLANPILSPDERADVATPSMKPSKAPLIGGLFQPTQGRGTLDEAYDRMEEIQQVKGTFNRMVAEGRRAEAQAFAQEYSNKLAAMSMSGSVQKQLGTLAAMERQIKAAPNMTTEQKDARLEQIDKVKMNIARQFLAVSDKTTRQ